MRELKDKNRREFVYCVCLSVGFASLVLYLMSSKYAFFLSMDDVGIRNVVSGIYTGKPVARTFFMEYPLTKVLSLLYRLDIDTYWYLYFLILSNYGCLALIIFKIVRSVKKYKIFWAVVTVLCYLILWLENLVYLEWTVTAGLLAASGIFLYATTKTEEKKWYRYVLPLLLLALAWNVRSQVAELALPFFGVVFLSRVFPRKGKRDRELIKRDLLFVLALGAAVILCYGADRFVYSSEKWVEAKNFSDLRSDISDRYGLVDYDEWKPLMEENGISKEMYEIIVKDRNNILTSVGVLKADDLEEVVEKTKEVFYEKTSVKDKIAEFLTKRIQEIKEKYGFYTVLLYLEIGIAVICGILNKNWGHVFLCLAMLAGFEVIWLWLYYGNYVPDRVGVALYIIAIAAGTVFLWREPIVEKLLHNKIVGAVLLAAIIALTGKSFYTENQEYKELEVYGEWLATAKQYCEAHKENVYIRDFQGFRYNELQNGDERTAANFLPSSSWLPMLPLKNQYVPTGGKQEICSWISKQDNVYLMTRSRISEGSCSRIEALFASRGIDCQLVLEDTIELPNTSRIEVYRFQCTDLE